jgi:hypothetical protein
VDCFKVQPPQICRGVIHCRWTFYVVPCALVWIGNCVEYTWWAHNRPPRGWPGRNFLLDQHLACTAREDEVSSPGHSVMFDYITGPFQCEPGIRNSPYRNASMGVSIPVPFTRLWRMSVWSTSKGFWLRDNPSVLNLPALSIASEWIRSSPADNRYPSCGFLQMLHKKTFNIRHERLRHNFSSPRVTLWNRMMSG